MVGIIGTRLKKYLEETTDEDTPLAAIIATIGAFYTAAQLTSDTILDAENGEELKEIQETIDREIDLFKMFLNKNLETKNGEEK